MAEQKYIVLLFAHSLLFVLRSQIAGFTAWSSSHDPGQVFTLLQTLYAAFDSIAKKRNVFKVSIKAKEIIDFPSDFVYALTF